MTGPSAPLSARLRDAARALGAVLAGALLLMAATVAIGRPTLMTDSSDYAQVGLGVISAARDWVVEGRPPITAADLMARRGERGTVNARSSDDLNGGRSPFYGVLLASVLALGGLWTVAVVQALAASAMLYAAWRLCAPGAAGWTWPALMAALASASSLPVFTAFASPDVFSGLAVLLAGLWLLYAERLGRVARVGVVATLTLLLTFHTGNLINLVVLLVLAVAAGAGFGAGRTALRRSAVVLAAVLVAFAAGRAYGYGHWLRTGGHLRNPPFLTARLIADGPGRDYLRARCPADPRFVVCAYRNLPLDDSDDILWSEDPGRGVFDKLEPPDRARMEAEEPAFAAAVIAFAPGAQLAASARNWGSQLTLISYTDALLAQSWFLADPFWSRTRLARLIRRAGPCEVGEHRCDFHLEPTFLWRWHAAVATAALTALAAAAARLQPWRREDRRAPPSFTTRAWALAAWLLAGVAVNAATCGVLSGPFPRYQARIVWMVLAAAGLLAISLAAAHRPQPDRSAPAP